MTTEISAKVVLDSVSPAGVRLTTLEVIMPRIILSEFNTHRVFSRNSASSRAIPFAVTSRRIQDDPFIPVTWPSNQSGMQGGEALTGQAAKDAEAAWLDARFAAWDNASRLHALGVHKSLVNRLLEPFMWHTVLVTSTEWENFFEQRDSPLAEAHMELVAKAMRAALNESTPHLIPYSGWHLPLTSMEDLHLSTQRIKEVSAARCAQVSYDKHNSARDVEKDLTRARMLWGNGHWSPFEHVATPAHPHDRTLGNFQGWHQMRHYDA